MLFEIKIKNLPCGSIAHLGVEEGSLFHRLKGVPQGAPLLLLWGFI